MPMSSVAANKKPRVAVLGNLRYVGGEYLKGVKAELDLEVSTETVFSFIASFE